MKKLFGLLIPMILIVFGEPCLADVPAADPRWFACTSNDDCLIIRGVCDWSAANKNFAAEAERHFESMMPYVECAPNLYHEPPPAAICKANVCTVEKE